MKLIEALKKIKDLQKKAEDLRDKIGKNSVYLNVEKPIYPDQKRQVAEWLQSHSDILKEILRLRVAIQKTNLETLVVIEINGKQIKRSIAEWIHRRRDLAILERDSWKQLTDRNLKEGYIKQSNGEDMKIEIVRCYDPATRDAYLDIYDNEPSLVDAKLEITNAVTDLIE